MGVKSRARGSPRPTRTDNEAPILTYNAWLAALQDGCQCRACAYLRQLTRFMPAAPISTEVPSAALNPEAPESLNIP